VCAAQENDLILNLHLFDSQFGLEISIDKQKARSQSVRHKITVETSHLYQQLAAALRNRLHTRQAGY
jgi:hypothetical protein